MKTIKFYPLIAILFILSACAKAPNSAKAKKFFNSSQLIVVTSNSWNSNSARLFRFEKVNGKWVMVAKPIYVKIGRNGMAWGKGVYTAYKGGEPIKREGDGRAPAGIFRLPFIFGSSKANFNYPYLQVSRYHRCVDDYRSKYYNQIIDSRKTRRDYRSFENMVLRSGLYRYGVFVAHNPNRVAKAGSCIFLHIKSPSNRATSGCTAMRADELLGILKWLKRDKNPLLIQAPREAINRLLPKEISI